MEPKVEEVEVGELQLVSHPRAKSKVWKHFGFDMEEDQVGKKARCRLCLTQIGYSGNTTNLYAHLQRHHPDAFMEFEKATPDSPQTPQTHTSPPQASFRLTTQETKRQSEVSTAMLSFLLEGLHPLTTVDEPFFRALLHTMDPRCSPPTSGELIAQALPLRHQAVRAAVAAELGGEDAVGVAVDLWRSETHGGRSYVTLYAHLLTRTTPPAPPPGLRLLSRCIKTFEVPADSAAEGVTRALYEAFMEWGVAARVRGATTRGSPDVLKACAQLNLPVLLPCFAERLEGGIRQAFQVPAVQGLLLRCRRLVDYFQQSVVAAYMLQERLKQQGVGSSFWTGTSSGTGAESGTETRAESGPEIRMGSESTRSGKRTEASTWTGAGSWVGSGSSGGSAGPKWDVESSPGVASVSGPLVLGRPSCWASTLAMLERLREHQQAVTSVLLEDANNQALLLGAAEWSLLDGLLQLLRALRSAATMFCNCPYPAVSMLKPVLHMLLSTALRTREGDPSELAAARAAVATVLEEAYCTPPNLDMFLKVASFLDPRYKRLPFLSTSDRAQVESRVLEEAASLYQRHTAPASSQDQPPSKKQALGAPVDSPVADTTTNPLAVIFCQSGAADTQEEYQAQAEEELSNFKAQKVLGLNEDPLRWWSDRTLLFPMLPRVLQRYWCVPATSAPAHRLFGPSGSLLWGKRNRLDPELVDQQVFLYENTRPLHEADLVHHEKDLIGLP